MNARVETSIEVLAATPASPATPTGRLLVVGLAGTGPQNSPTLVRGMAEFRALFGSRTGATALYDALQQGFACGLAEAVVVRGTGPGAVKATASLDSATVTAVYAGAAANAWDAAINLTGTPTFTLNGPGFTETYTAAAKSGLPTVVNANSTRVTLTGTVGTADAEDLAGGTDDGASVDIETMLGLLGSEWGQGAAVAVPGYHAAAVGEDLANHATEYGRLALVSLAPATDKAAAKTAAATLAGYGSGRTVLLWPSLRTADGDVSWVGAAAGCRAKAHAQYGPQQSLIAASVGVLPFGEPEITATDADWRGLDDAGVSVLRTIGGRTRIAGWKLTDALGANLNLDGAQHADVLNAVQAQCQQVAEQFVGTTMDGRGIALQQFAAQLIGVCRTFAATGALSALVDVNGQEIDPGFVVDVGPSVNAPADIAAGRIAAHVGVRLSATAEFIRLTISVADAATVSL